MYAAEVSKVRTARWVPPASLHAAAFAAQASGPMDQSSIDAIANWPGSLPASSRRARSWTARPRARSFAWPKRKPSPRRTARRSVGSAPPPNQIGMGSGGRGRMPARSMWWKSPCTVTTGSAQSRRSTSTCSSSLRPRSSNTSPSDWYSTQFHPEPTPRRSRPWDSTATSAACLATSAVCRWGSTRTPTTSSSRWVSPARYPKSTKGSWKASSSVYGPVSGGSRSACSAPRTWSYVMR